MSETRIDIRDLPTMSTLSIPSTVAGETKTAPTVPTLPTSEVKINVGPASEILDLVTKREKKEDKALVEKLVETVENLYAEMKIKAVSKITRQVRFEEHTIECIDRCFRGSHKDVVDVKSKLFSQGYSLDIHMEYRNSNWVGITLSV